MKKLTKKEWIAVVISVFVVGFFFIFGQSFITLFKSQEADNSRFAAPQVSTKLDVQDVVLGTGEVAEAGNRVTINYIGHLSDGTVFDSSAAHTEPAQFALGSGQVIEGLDRGVLGMRVGGKRTLTISPEMGYGANDYGPIPGNSTLTFEIELLKIEK